MGGVIPVYLIDDVGKAALELEPESFGKLKALGEAQREIKRFRPKSQTGELTWLSGLST